jgi:glucosamine--fructose-6-phosphate aminotransferase (isomerizing)
MCGIVGYVGSQSALDVVMAGLKRLEYRGYDSAGVAVPADGGLAAARKAGKLVNLEKELTERPLPAGTTGIGHTRWATHGGPTDANAHPHLDNAGRVAVVHNGIIENFAVLRAELAERGHVQLSETDTEVVAHLLAEEFSVTSDLAEAMRLVCRRLEGAFTLVAVHADEPDVVVGARRNSPLVVGVGEGEAFLASDVAAFIAHTRSAIELGQDQVVELRRDGVTVTGFDGRPADVRSYHVDWDASAAEKGGYDYFMLKEIAEQPKAVADTLLGRIDASGALTLDEVRIPPSELREVDKVVIVACGTAVHAGLIG